MIQSARSGAKPCAISCSANRRSACSLLRAGVGAETARALGDRSGVGAAGRELAPRAARSRTLAERFELRCEVGDALFEHDALVDFRRERLLERREPRGRKPAVVRDGPPSGRRALPVGLGFDERRRRARRNPERDREPGGEPTENE